MPIFSFFFFFFFFLLCVFCFFFFFFFFCCLGILMAHESSQARGQISAVAAGLCHSHNNGI